ncbi:hypothetical protein SVA_1072 [Sulfurifustis variabilis]|uniref:Uncharacterized protein n=1 Tax=Sulfurifustis variabilis TaxID=1675686 RepID=A0A1B4VB82_9GAMM|nr:hypothetical protein [Sulfurifustis variabilis]BAU47651.1 hypothetical protein SVA_1072 [Sulfurifustis variabilis]
MKTPLEVSVECYAGYRGEQEPRAFSIGQRRIAVEEILDRWIAPDHRYFKVRGDDGASYVVRHDAAADRWELAFYRR